MDAYMELTQIFKLLREKYHFAQEEMAYKCQVQSGYISKIERGTHNPNLETIKKIATAFGLSIVELLSLNEAFLQKPDLDPITFRIISLAQNLSDKKEQFLEIGKTFIK